MRKKKKKKRQTTSSIGQREVSNVLKKMRYHIVDEFCINNWPFDIYIKELNLIIEYYGNRWHYHKKLYTPDYWDKVKKRYAYQKWEKDKYKVNFAKEQGYDIEIIWEYDWKRLSNKRTYIEKLLKKYQ